MENFVMYNPVKLHFGDGVTDQIGKIAARYGQKVLLVMGKGSAKASGAYEMVNARLQSAGLQIWEYNGIKSNPVIEDVDSAAALGREHKVDLVIGLGGGSVIDSAKIIALAIKYDGPAWDIMEGKHKPKEALPLLAILTLAATGTEMNPYAVLQHNCQQKKIGYGSKLIYPQHSFLDPSFTLSVPKDYTAYGIADLIAHSLEAWFGEGDTSLSDRFILAIIKEATKYGPALLNNLNSYDLRARVMYAATCALNGMTAYGKKNMDWGVHAIGHCLSVVHDVPHGASLTIAYPAWLKLHRNRIPERIQELGTALLGTNTIEDTIYKLEYFFKTMGCPVRLKDAGILLDDHTKREKLKTVMIKNKVSGLVHKLEEKDYDKLLKLME